MLFPLTSVGGIFFALSFAIKTEFRNMIERDLTWWSMTAVKFDVLRFLTAGSLSPSYAALGTPLTSNWRLMKVTNTSNSDVFVSLDGVVANMIVPAGGFTLYDFSTNEPGGMGVNDNMVVSIGTQFYVAAGSPSSGGVYLEGIYS